MEWFILIALAAIVLLPIVLLTGFAGCGSFGTSEPDPPAAPSNLQAFAGGTDKINLSWQDNTSGTANYIVERLDNGAWTMRGGELATKSVSFTDVGLTPSTQFTYRVKAKSPSDGLLSNPSNEATATTAAVPIPTWKLAYGGAPDTELTISQGGLANQCIVQRISAARLMNSGTKVRITLRSSLSVDLSIAKIFISQAAVQGAPQNPTPDLWDSAADLKDVRPGGLLMTTAKPEFVLDPIDYTLDENQDLIVAFDISTPGGTRKRDGVTGTVCYTKDNTAEASTPNRGANYLTRANSVYIVHKIEVM